MLIQFEKEICFGYTGSEWIKEKLNTFGISIFLEWSFIKRKQLCNVWERRMVFLWSWCWLGLESGKCKWWLWFDFFYSNICKLPQEVCMLEFFSLCVFFFAVVVVFFSTCLLDVVLVFGSFLKEILYKKKYQPPLMYRCQGAFECWRLYIMLLFCHHVKKVYYIDRFNIKCNLKKTNLSVIMRLTVKEFYIKRNLYSIHWLNS